MNFKFYNQDKKFSSRVIILGSRGIVSQSLKKTLKERLGIAESLRKKSLQETKGKGEDIMDVNRQAVEEIFNQYHVDILIHGHTHRPNIHELQINNKNVKRVVLGDWYTSSYLLKYKKEKIIIDKTNLINQKSS